MFFLVTLMKNMWQFGKHTGKTRVIFFSHVCRHPDDKYGFLLLTPVGTSKGLDDVDTEWNPSDYRFDMGIEFEIRVESHY